MCDKNEIPTMKMFEELGNSCSLPIRIGAYAGIKMQKPSLDVTFYTLVLPTCDQQLLELQYNIHSIHSFLRFKIFLHLVFLLGIIFV